MAKKGTLLLAALGAFAYYKYNKMSAEEKANIKDTIKKQGEKVLENLPSELKNIFKPKSETTV